MSPTKSTPNSSLLKDQIKLIKWYQQNKRDLPWRKNNDPYRIWISEVMLQQTTVAAVIAYYERFMLRFPKIENLAQARIEDVYEQWAGLGYYSRARNLHKAAQVIFKEGFPRSSSDLIKLPGFGPYTANAVASLAYGERCGVLDGNVIRILSRKHGLKIKWWERSGRETLQQIANELAQTNQSSDLNQGLMELGATICTPKKTLCVLCPWNSDCVSFKDNLIEKLPLKKPKDDFEIWSWSFDLKHTKDSIFLKENKTTPFLKLNLLPESSAQKVSQKPKAYDFKHSVTKYQIFIKINAKSLQRAGQRDWYSIKTIHQINPTSLMKKILKHANIHYED